MCILFICSFIPHVLFNLCVPGTVLGAEDRVVNKVNIFSILKESLCIYEIHRVLELQGSWEHIFSNYLILHEIKPKLKEVKLLTQWSISQSQS